MALGSTGTPGTHQARWRRAGGRGRAPDSKEGRAEKSRRGREGWEGKWVKQKVRLRPQRGPRGLEVLRPPGWDHRGQSQSPPPSHGPRGAAEGLPWGLHPECRLQAAFPSRASARPPAGQRGWLGLRSGDGHWAWRGCGGQKVTQSPRSQPWGRQTDRQTDRRAGDARLLPARPPPGSFAAWCFASPCSLPPSQPPTRCWGWGAVTSGPPES